MDDINGRMKNGALKAMFTIRKGNLKEKKVYGVRYTSLIPSLLRRKYITYPKISLLRGIDRKSWVISGIEKIKLELLKSDRNNKEVTFGVIALLLHCDVIMTSSVLRGVAQAGLETSGCALWRHCDGEKHCTDKLQASVSIYHVTSSQPVKIGSGMVDPFTTFLMGQELDKTSIVLQFARLDSPETSFNGLERQELLSRPVIWERSSIGRITILGPLDEHWGDAILVSKDANVMKHFIHQDGNGHLHYKHALLLCDLQVSDLYSNQIYPYSIWYGNNFAKKIRRINFCDDTVPITLGDIPGKTSAFFWHSEQIAEKKHIQ